MPQMIISYPSPGPARFDWAYYVERHLPLAVGTSMRHSRITRCDVARPIPGQASDLACICIVHFADAQALGDFRALFTGHADAQAVIVDEPNYTDLKPVFMATSDPYQPAALPAFRFHARAGAGEADRFGEIGASARFTTEPGFGPATPADASRFLWRDFSSQAALAEFVSSLDGRVAQEQGSFEVFAFDLAKARK